MDGNRRAWFWAFVASLGGGAPFDEQHVSDRIALLTNDELVIFEQYVRHSSLDLGVAPVYGALSVAHGDTPSDDVFEYLRYWIVFNGQKTFEAVLENPDHLAALLIKPCSEQVDDWMSIGEWLGYAVEWEWEFRGLDIEVLENRVGILRGAIKPGWEWQVAVRLRFPKIESLCKS